MSLIQYLRFKKKSAKIAKNRLQIIIAQERGGENNEQNPDYLPMLRQEILTLIAKYTKADVSQVKVDFQCKQNSTIIELNLVLPENSE